MRRRTNAVPDTVLLTICCLPSYIRTHLITYVRVIGQENSTDVCKELSKSISDHHLSTSNK